LSSTLGGSAREALALALSRGCVVLHNQAIA
jgi:hypothetical protein